jgi:branched-chain amino acid transport system ATP-binding protein
MAKLNSSMQINCIQVHLIVALSIAHSPEGRGIFGRMNVRENIQLGATVTKDNE